MNNYYFSAEFITPHRDYLFNFQCWLHKKDEKPICMVKVAAYGDGQYFEYPTPLTLADGEAVEWRDCIWQEKEPHIFLVAPFWLGRKAA